MKSDPPLMASIVRAELATDRNPRSAMVQYDTIIADARFAGLEESLRAACHLNRGNERRKLSRCHEALKDYAHAAQLAPTTFKPHFNAGLVLAHDLREFAAAKAAFDRAIALNPGSVEVLYSRALVEMELHENEKAARDVNAALVVAPDDTNALCILKALHMKRDQKEPTTQARQNALTFAPHEADFRSHVSLALSGWAIRDAVDGNEKTEEHAPRAGETSELPGFARFYGLVVFFAVAAAANIFAGTVGLSIVVFLAPLIVRGYIEYNKIPVELKLEWTLHRGARALRQLGRARRNTLNSPEFAARIAKRAFRVLRTVKRNVVAYGCPLQIVRRLDLALNTPLIPTSLPSGDRAALLNEVQQCLDEAESTVGEWDSELNAADRRLASECDPAIYQSNAVLRDPFEHHALTEGGQTYSINNVRRSQDDLRRVKAALSMAEEMIGSFSNDAIANTIEAVDIVLGNADMPLPPELATGEGPHDFSNPPPPPGALQRLHGALLALHCLQLSTISNS